MSTVPRVALRCPDEAAEALGVERDFFNEHIRPEVRLIRRGRLTFVAVRELERWAEENAARTLRKTV
jgi:DNA-binding HxlR family transcriptional regulator